METAERVAGIIAALKEEYPDPVCALQYRKDYELMISVRLSAQCTDARVNLVTPALFARVDGVMLSDRPDTDAMLSAIARGDCGALCANVQNVFEQALPDAQRERIEEIKRALVENGAACAAMTGSGSAVFGLFSDEVLCRNACEVLQGDRVETFFAEFV